MLCRERLFSALVRRHADDPCLDKTAVSRKKGNLIGFEKGADSVRQLRDDLVFARQHFFDINRNGSAADPMVCRMNLQLLIALRRIQQGLGRNTADIKAGPAHRGFAALANPTVDAGRF